MVFFTTLERSNDVVQQCNGNFFMMKTVEEMFFLSLKLDDRNSNNAANFMAIPTSLFI